MYITPKVSVCMPNYNYGNFIGRAIQSVLNQTFTNFELIIVDDDSIDNSVSVIRSFSDERIKFYKNEKNIGRVKNINKCLSLASGEYVTLLPSDDIYMPAFLEKSVKILDLNLTVGLTYSSSRIIDENGDVISEYRPFDQDYIRSGEEEFKNLILGNYISALTAMVRRECYASLGTFDEAVTGGADWNMWLRISLNNYDIAFMSEVLACDRKHSSNISMYHTKTNLRGMNRYRVLKTVFSNLPPHNKHLSYLETYAVQTLANNMITSAGYNLIKGQNDLARMNIGLAVAIDDKVIKNWRCWIILFATFIGGFIPGAKRMLPLYVKETIYKAGQKVLVRE